MAVNLGKNRLDLLTAYQDVIDETSDTDWALYTYEDESDDLKLASSGGGGLAGITLTFDSARVMYGFCSLKEPAAALPRYILINWVGDDVADARKCACASHVATIANFLQGVELTVNASSLEDIEPSAIGQRLTNGTAVVASPVLSRLKTREEDNKDVGTVYEKTNAEVEMKKINREEFWEQAKREEEVRKEEEKKKVAEERQRFDEERMELERKEQESRELRYREREQQIEEHRKKLLEEEEAKERLQSQAAMAAKASLDDLNLDKKETEAEEAKAIIAQRSGNPREFFKQKERAMTISVDTSPVSVHRSGSRDLNMAAVSPIPKIVTTSIIEDFSREDEDGRDEWGSEPKKDQKAPAQDSAPTKPVQSVAPQTRDSSGFSAWESGTDRLVNLWDSSADGPESQNSQSSNLVDLMGDAAIPPGNSAKPQPLLSFDDMIEGSMCSATGPEDDPTSLVDVMAEDQMTLSYQHALQHASGEKKELLMTNGETKEGTQVRQASEGYFSQSQEEQFGQSESSAKPAPVFYNKPPEIDITCWDADPVGDEDSD
ncbi:drebrin isoform X6 [Gymnodraco acuticeps]|uniref:Drebrin n=1 Tax=Gymnodraco acuticeps TaxID=8218 RepID=A0A6P8VSK4_GYMAC|nr:drebrin isoform X6 [Gymnodraco acuticeps]